jgi:CRP-like cAMP-binding protein
MSLRPRVAAPGEVIVRKGDPGAEMYLIARGEAEVLDGAGRVVATLREGDCFGEMALLLSEPRTATVRAATTCDLLVLGKADFSRILRDHEQFAHAVTDIVRERYDRTVAAHQLMAAKPPAS